MHRLLYSAAPLLAGSLAMGPALASPLMEYCDRSKVHMASGSGGAASDVSRCPFCRMPPEAHGHGSNDVPPHPPLWHRGIPARTPYPKLAMAEPATPSARGADGVKICLTCHDGSLAAMLIVEATDAKNVPDSSSGKRDASLTASH